MSKTSDAASLRGRKTEENGYIEMELAGMNKKWGWQTPANTLP